MAMEQLIRLILENILDMQKKGNQLAEVLCGSRTSINSWMFDDIADNIRKSLEDYFHTSEDYTEFSGDALTNDIIGCSNDIGDDGNYEIRTIDAFIEKWGSRIKKV